MVELSARLLWGRRRARLRMGKAIHCREPHVTWTKKNKKYIYILFVFFFAGVFRLDFKVRSNAQPRGGNKKF